MSESVHVEKDRFKNILILADMVEADLMEKLLAEEGLPFYIRPWRDVNFDGMFVNQKGFGWLMGRTVDEEKIRTLYATGIDRKDDST